MKSGNGLSRATCLEEQTFGYRLCELRAYYELTQIDVADMVNCCARQIWRWETNKNYAQKPYMFRLARAFGCSVEWIEGKADAVRPEVLI